MSQTNAKLKRLRSPSPRPAGFRWEGDAWIDNLDHLGRGALAGVVATGFMTAVIAGGRALRLIRTPPPSQITGNVLRRAGLRPRRDEPAFHIGSLAAHVGYGAGCGAGYVAVRPLLPKSTVQTGLLFGGVIWTASYCGLMPALGLYPWPDDDSKSRIAVMMLAHAVFGTSLAEIERQVAHR